MALKLVEFMKDRYNAFAVTLGTERHAPGMLLETDWRPKLLGLWHGDPEFEREDGFAWDLLHQPADGFRSSFVAANIIQESINEKRSLGAGVDLPQLGITFSTALDSAFSALLKVTGIKARVFDDSAAPYHLIEALLRLKTTDKQLWDWVNDDCLVTESYHVASLSAEFKSEGTVSAKAAFEKAGHKVDAGVQCRWISESVMELVGTVAVPIAVRGLKV